MSISPSLLPQVSISSFSCRVAAAGSGTRSAGGFVFGADENPPIQAKRSRCVSPKFSVCPPPIDSPARARLSRSVFTE